MSSLGLLKLVRSSIFKIPEQGEVSLQAMNLLGTMLAASTVYAALYGNPVGNPYDYYGKIGADDLAAGVADHGVTGMHAFQKGSAPDFRKWGCFRLTPLP